MLKDFKENEKRTEKVLVLGVEEKKTAREVHLSFVL